MQLKQLSPDKQQKILWLHHKAFSDSACQECKGGCCTHCAYHNGYIHSEDEWKQLASKYEWTASDGFRGESGCKLPITERSSTCLGFICNGVDHGKNFNFGPRNGVNKPFTKEQQEAAYQIQRTFFS